MKFIEKLKLRRKKRNKSKNRFFVINAEGWYFDSSKANLIAKYVEWTCSRELYLTDKENWIEIENKNYARKLNLEEVKNILKELNKVKVYEKYFQKLEEV